VGPPVDFQPNFVGAFWSFWSFCRVSVRYFDEFGVQICGTLTQCAQQQQRSRARIQQRSRARIQRLQLLREGQLLEAQLLLLPQQWKVKKM